MGLLPGPLTPSLQERAARLGAWVPGPRATTLLAHFTHTAVSEPTVRRQTAQAGAAAVAVQTATVERVERAAPAPPAGPALQPLSVAGAMVPLVGQGGWAAVKALALGTVQPPVREDGQPVVHTTALSSFARLADHATFTRRATVATHRRGGATAGRVVAVNDGALWAQHSVDYHRPDAIRIPGALWAWGHAAEYLGAVARACVGADTTTAERWLAAHLRDLLAGDPAVVLGTLRGLRDEPALAAADAAAQATLATVTTSVHSLERRREQRRYADFRAAGDRGPSGCGSGSVERAHTAVVAARLKGAGRHRARDHVDPLLALRNAVCNDRWAEAWAAICAEVRRQQRARLRAKRQRRRAAAAPPPAPRRAPAAPAPRPRPRAAARPAPAAAAAPRRPAASHPWRRYGQPLNAARQREVASTVQ